MPRLTSIDGVDIYMYFKDHAPPHVHGIYGDDEAVVTIRDGGLYAGGLPATKLAVVSAYVLANNESLLAKWRAFGGG